MNSFSDFKYIDIYKKIINMKMNRDTSRIKDFGLFLETKKEGEPTEKPTQSEVQKEVRKIISEMFAYGKNITFSGDKDGEPEYVEFEINDKDASVDYDEDLFMEYSDNVLKKRKYQVALKYSSKKNTGTENHPVHTIKFKIKLKPTSEITPEKETYLCWEFEEKPKDVIKFLKEEGIKPEWDSSTNILKITQSNYEKTDTDQLKVIIRECGGQKVRIK